MSSNEQETNNTPQIGSYRYTDLVESIGKKSYLNAKTADVHFSFGLNDAAIRVPAHKSVLAAGSDVFEAMFYGDLKEKGDVHITDASEAAFMEFLQFFYLTEVKLTIENIAGVMQLGHKYNVPKCVSVCVQFLKDSLTVDNIFIGWKLAIVYDHQELMKIFEIFIMLNASEVFQSTGFKECDRQALAHILKMDILSCSEVEVFKACMAWVRARSKQNALTKALVEEYLGDLYYEIRFTSMTMQELCLLQTEYESVLQNDYPTIINMIVQPEFQAEKFKKDPRRVKWDANAIIECDRTSKKDTESSYFTRDKLMSTFSTDQPLLLGSFVCSKVTFYDSSNRDLTSDLPVEVEIFETCTSGDQNPRSLLSLKAKLKSASSNHIQLPYPVLIRPKFTYKICIGDFPDRHVYHSNALNEEIRLKHDITVKFLGSKNCKGKIIALISILNFNRVNEG